MWSREACDEAHHDESTPGRARCAGPVRRAGRRPVHHRPLRRGHRCVHRVGHGRRRAGPIPGLPLLPPGRTQRRHHQRVGRGSRCRPEPGRLLPERRGLGLPGREAGPGAGHRSPHGLQRRSWMPGRAGARRDQLELPDVALRRALDDPPRRDVLRLPRRHPPPGGAQGRLPEPEGHRGHGALGGRAGDQPLRHVQRAPRRPGRAGELRRTRPATSWTSMRTPPCSGRWETGAGAADTTSGPTDSRTAPGTRRSSATSNSRGSSPRVPPRTSWARWTSSP